MDNAGLDASDPLTQLELRVARRADEIAALKTVPTALNLACWMQAEHEIVGSEIEPTGCSG